MWAPDRSNYRTDGAMVRVEAPWGGGAMASADMVAGSTVGGRGGGGTLGGDGGADGGDGGDGGADGWQATCASWRGRYQRAPLLHKITGCSSTTA